jgi:hypothetical protein
MLVYYMQIIVIGLPEIIVLKHVRVEDHFEKIYSPIKHFLFTVGHQSEIGHIDVLVVSRLHQLL